MERDAAQDAKESKRQRDVWLMAIGGALADDSLRPKLVGYAPSGLADLVTALRNPNAKAAWRELKKWGLVQAGKDRAADRLFAELEAIERRRQVVHVVNDLVRLTLDGDECGIEAKAKEVLTILEAK